MTCEEALLAISAALDGELPPRERAKLSEHLLTCPECRELAADLRVLADALEDSDREPPAGLAAAVRAAVAGEGRRSRPPYLRTVAAMLALCVGLGCIGLFVSGRNGMKGGSAGEVAVPAPALYQAPPENMERSADAGCDGMENADVTCDNNSSMDKAEPDAPMEAAPAPSEEGAPIPMPSIAPESPDAADPVYEGFGGMPEEDAPAAGAEKKLLAPEDALELAFQYTGGYETYPEALRYDAEFGIGYTLQTVETETVRSKYCLHYVGLTDDGKGYRFHLYEDVTDKADGGGHTATTNWIEVSRDSGEISTMF